MFHVYVPYIWLNIYLHGDSNITLQGLANRLYVTNYFRISLFLSLFSILLKQKYERVDFSR